MRKNLLIAVASVLALTGSALGAPILFDVDPTATYLRLDPTDVTYSNPLFINLSTYGLTPGMSVQLQTLGDMAFYSGGAEIAMPLAGIWVNMAAVNSDTSLLYRLSSIANPDGAPIGASNLTYPGGLPTDIAWDFEIPLGGGVVTIPTGATYLAVGVIDSWYTDNSDGNGDLQVSIEASQVPEPGTLILLVPGLGLLWAIRRRRNS